jgi:molybdate transport system ATP-binding protein
MDKTSLPRRRLVAKPLAALVPVLECRHVSLTLGGKRIIHDLNWTVRAGEQWALVGPNGAGKSSLAGLIAGDIPQAYAQDIRLFGRPRGSGETIWQIKHQIGFYSPELLAQFPDHLTVQAAVLSGFFNTLGVFRRCSTPQRRSALRWLKRLKLSGVRRHLFYELSEGEQRLVLVTRALVKRSALLILDEPFQNLDAAHRARLRRALEYVATAGTTALILIVHRPVDLPGTITHRLRLRAGRVQHSGCDSTG